ncbi:hypothetical protein DSL72_007775 [Monilinia vaccinii-corymbosi]|uniref:RRM domain-containing protein n=1 Tax=Monilinia vaccinii-corymbosi TaxID=61207 RepID=A0A8A3PIQ7_9HELO|nr:hypothetical protein DSL72_007775 [Monilinia vaccinii-corymbosi]
MPQVLPNTMYQVLPGDITGLYYITVSNLPWTCTWQTLKDYARNQDSKGNCLAIVHAHVCGGISGPLTGWVSVQGKEDFIKALRHLERGVIGNRALIVDGRNETCSIPLFDLSGPRMWKDFNEDVSTRDIMPATREAPITTSMTATFNNNRGGTKFQPSHSTGISYCMPILPAFSVSMVAGTPLFVPPLLPYAISPPSTLASTPSSVYSQTTTGQFHVMTIEKRKVIITQISRHTSTLDLRQFIHERIMAKFADKALDEDPFLALQRMTIAQHPDGKQKSHAFVIFQTYVMAQVVVDILDGVEFRGKVLRAKLAKEGAQPAGVDPSSFPPALERRSRPQSQVALRDAISSKTRPPREKKLGRLKEMNRTTEDRERGRIKESFISDVAAVAAAAKKSETSPKSPMVANGSSPGRNS